MVPVPEELVADVESFLDRKIQRPDPPSFEQRSVAEVVAMLDRSGRALLQIVAETALANEEVTITELAVSLGIHERAVVGLMVEVNHKFAVARAARMVMLPSEPPGTPAGAQLWNERIVVMPDDLAQALLAALADVVTPA